MRIAVFGSWREADTEWAKRGTFEEFCEAAREIGRELARLGQTVILGGESRETIDLHVVEGVVEVAGDNPDAPALIEVIKRSEASHPYSELARRYPHLFEFHYEKRGWWEGAHLIALQRASAAVTMGGGNGTFVVGLAALLCGKRVVPIGSFGGASERLLREAKSLAPSGRARLQKLNSPWTPYILKVVMEACGASSQPRLLLIHGHGPGCDELESWLREQFPGNDVVVMAKQFGGGETLPQKFERLSSEVDGAIAIATPDDVGAAVQRTTSGLQSRSRQNVWLEVGWFWGRLGLRRLMVLVSGEVEIPSDLQGLELYRYERSPVERAADLREFIRRLRE
ncbi:MAG TPA: TIR domain-containing protein [Longimicrobium sp.]|nr:TIR domain-containing protein [Longimicrobium sp.]